MQAAERVSFRENTAQEVRRELRQEITSVADYLTGVLRPRRPLVSVDGEKVAFRNLVGSAQLPSGSIVEVAPKVEAADDWTDAVVQLLEPTSRIAVAGSRRSQPSARTNDLTSALAVEYARRLETALRSEGPLQVYERQHQVSRRLKGRLDVTKWVRSAVLDPAKFPTSRDEFTVANDFTRGLSLVAGWLGRAAVGGELSAQLRRLQSAVIPGHPLPSYVNPAVARRTLPTQWGRYGPAWDIAAALLRHRSVVGDPGRATGLEVAIEPWPLLETALTRALHALTQRDAGFEVLPKGGHRLLATNGRTAVSVIPDGALERHGVVVATFECKYTVPGSTPDPDHVHQALATAAALSSPLSILVYPGDQPAVRYGVTGFHGAPVELITTGLSLYSYRRGVGDEERAELISGLLE